MSFKLSMKSRGNLRGVHPALVKVVERAIELTTVDFVVFEGLRSKAQQALNIKRGVSWTMRSKHLTGHAVDLVALVGGKPTWSWAPYYVIAKAMKQAAKELGVVVTWGGDWKKVKDGPHFELDPKKYPMKEK